MNTVKRYAVFIAKLISNFLQREDLSDYVFGAMGSLAWFWLYYGAGLGNAAPLADISVLFIGIAIMCISVGGQKLLAAHPDFTSLLAIIVLSIFIFILLLLRHFMM